MVSDERFFAWLDGELGPDEAASVAAEVAGDPILSKRAEQHRAMQQRLRAAFNTVAEAEVPAPLIAAVQPAEAEVIDFASSRRGRDVRRWAALPQWAALAASLAVGILIGTAVPERAPSPVSIKGGTVLAAASLDQALTSQLASASSGDTRIGLTFRDRSGAICRTFTGPAASGLACRRDGNWQIRGLFAAPEGQSGAYRMAAGMDPGLATLVDSTMAGEPLDAGAERTARDRGWR
jgi:hypothetical protein